MSITQEKLKKEEYQKLKKLAAIDFDNEKDDDEVIKEIEDIIWLLQKLNKIDTSEIEDDFANQKWMHLNSWVEKLPKKETDEILSNARQLEWNAIVTSQFVN